MYISSLLASTTWEQFVGIFTGEFAWITITLMVLGMALCIIEAVVPGFGVFGISGIVCEVAAVVVHIIVCKGTPFQIFILILILVLVTLLIFLLFVRSAKFGMLGKTALVENKTAIPTNYGEDSEEELKKLIGKEGITITECRPVGKMRINDKIYEVSAKDVLISKGDVVKVVAVEGSNIYISKITY